MKFTGFADEAGSDIRTQVEATKELGWQYIESRNIDGTNIHDISNGDFNGVCNYLEETGIKISCFGSEISNWKKDVRNQSDLDLNMEQLKRAVPRMKRLNCKYLRGMSFTQIQGEKPDTKEIRELVVENLKKVVQICEDNGIIYLHENCMNFGGLSQDHTLYLIDQIKSPAFKLIFDTGNPVNTWDHLQYPPIEKQKSWDFYRAVKKHIEYIHIKDCIYQKEGDGLFAESEYVWPGHGHGDVKKILTDLVETCYDGFISIEPHMAAVFHDAHADVNQSDPYTTYVEYGKKLESLIADILISRMR